MLKRDNRNGKNKNKDFERIWILKENWKYVYWTGENPQEECSGDRFFIEGKLG